MALGARRANGGGGSGGGGGGGNGGSMGGGGGGGGGGDRELKGFATFHMLPSTAEGCEKLHPANLKNCTLHLQNNSSNVLWRVCEHRYNGTYSANSCCIFLAAVLV